MDHLKPTLTVDLAQYSDKGVKAENQDTIGARIPAEDQTTALSTKGITIAIADGVSSSAAAQEASQTAVKGFLTDYYATPDTWRTQQSAMCVIRSLNRYLWGQSRNNVREQGYLTTFSVLILKGNTCFTFHVGDTRIYRLRQNQLEQLTRDHTQRIDRATTYLSRALGADISVEVDMYSAEIQPGDLLVLSSDGIHDAIPERELQALILQYQETPEQLIEHAVSCAHKHKSQDNISIQAVRILSVSTPSKDDAITALSRLPFPPLLEPGDIFDGLTIEKILQESERSQVYLVRAADGKRLVMKTPSINYEDDPAFIERFVLESWIGSRIHSAHVVRVVTPQQTRSALYYLTEHIPGPTLEQLIDQRAPIAIPDAVELIEHAIKGVRAFHRKETLHQDLKPANIIIGKQGAVLIDFGSCWVAGIQELTTPIPRDVILGTMDYSAPEYRTGAAINQRADQFSLAVILYEMLTGKKPYGDAYGQATNAADFRRLRYIPAHTTNPMIPTWLDKALEKALQLQPEQRYPHMSEWLKDLQRPNPNWLTTHTTPLMQKNPLLFWKITATAGWAIALAMLVYTFFNTSATLVTGA